MSDIRTGRVFKLSLSSISWSIVGNGHRHYRSGHDDDNADDDDDNDDDHAVTGWLSG